MIKDALGLPQVGTDGNGHGVAGENGAGVRHGNGINVHVGHPGVGVAPLGDLVHAADRGDSRTEVEELVNAGVDEVPHGPPQERSVTSEGSGRLRVGPHKLAGSLTVNREVVRPAQKVVVHSRQVRPVHVDVYGSPVRPLHRCVLLVTIERES
jgi:hypothetical protein